MGRRRRRRSSRSRRIAACGRRPCSDRAARASGSAHTSTAPRRRAPHPRAPAPRSWRSGRPGRASRFDRSGRRVYTPAACPSPTSRPQNGQKEAPVTHVSVTVNGAMREADVEPRTLLVYFLRETLGLTGTNVGCDTSSCGSCTVLLDGESVKSCTLLAAQAAGRALTTIDGMAECALLHPLQEAFRRNHGLQCGYCTPGMILAAASYLEENPSPSEDDVRLALEGNLCRCTGDQNIVKSILDAAGSMAGGGV